MRIYTTAKLSLAGYLLDEADEPIAIPPGIYKCQIRNKRNDATPAFEFRTGGLSGGGILTKDTATIEGVSRDVLIFEAEQADIEDLRPGGYYADLVRVDVPRRIVGFRVTVLKGITH